MSTENIESALIPHRVVEDVYIGDMSPLRAWRLYQSIDAMCAKLGMTRDEYIELELKKHPDPELLKKAADALGITPEQLDVRGTYFGHAKDTENV